MNSADPIRQIQEELAATRRQLAAVEARLCTCRPERAPDTPSGYWHAADCIVTAAQQRAVAPR